MMKLFKAHSKHLEQMFHTLKKPKLQFERSNKQFFKMHSKYGTPSILLVIFTSLFMQNGIAQNKKVSLKVMSYNIHYGVGMDGKKDLHRIAEVIKKYDPDIVGLQEISDSLMVDTLSQYTNMFGQFGASTEIEPPNLYRLLGIPVPEAQLYYGDGILSKFPFTYIGNVSIPSASSSRYEAMCMDIKLPEKFESKTIIRVINTHFDWLKNLSSDQARLASVNVIEKAFIEEKPNYAYILTGDLNATPSSMVLKKMEKTGWLKEDFGKELYTVPVNRPRKQIDYVLVRPKKQWKIKDIQVIEEKMASDHLPILITLELK